MNIFSALWWITGSREQKDSSPGCALFCDVLICCHCYTCAAYRKRPCTCCSRPVLATVKFHCVGTFLLNPYEILSLGNGVVKPLPGAERSSLVCSVVGRKWKDIVAKGNMLMHLSCGPLRYWLPGCFVHFFFFGCGSEYNGQICPTCSSSH